MHGLKNPMKFANILAIDLGKFNSVAAIYDPATTEHSFLYDPHHAAGGSRSAGAVYR